MTGITVFVGCRPRRGFFGTPRGLGLATATTSAAFFPHLESALTHHAHEEIAPHQPARPTVEVFNSETGVTAAYQNASLQ